MALSIFLSYSMPIRGRQTRFINHLAEHLSSRGLSPRTLGVTDYDADLPLTAIRRLLLDTNGVIVVAFRRFRVERSDDQPRGVWTTSPYCHVEPALAFELGLPMLAVAEDGVIRDGVLRAGIAGPYVEPFNLRGSNDFLTSTSWLQAARKWEHQVRTVADRKGHPHRQYDL